jgi:hypothetical protein
MSPDGREITISYADIVSSDMTNDGGGKAFL